MKSHYDAIVVGSGFGGAVAACRLAQAGLDVLIMERGRRFSRNELGVDAKLPDEWLWETGGGMFDFKLLGGMVIVQGAAWGGGSQIYANVHLRPPHAVFERSWPAGLNRPALDPYFDLVAHMLDVAPITAAGALPKKTRSMQSVAEQLGRKDDFFYPNLAVRFGGAAGKNKFGVEQGPCRMCGECDLGCRYGAKNTLDLNYLAVAEQRGARVATDAEVTRVAPAQGGGYEVTYRGRVDARARTVQARAVFLCAGAVNTTELLLRCRDEHGTLPGLSERLGEGYSGNGDYMAFGVETDADLDPAEGPTITTALRYDRSQADGTWFLLEEGGYPHLPLVLEAARQQSRAIVDGVLAARAQQLANRVFDQRRTAVLLAMGLDRGDGRIELARGTRQLAIRWNVDANMHLYDVQERLASDVISRLGGTFLPNPTWQLLHRPLSAHSLGGCPMGPDGSRGVVDDGGEVHGYPGLFVLDGAAIPSAVGVNPSATIAAVAERNIERYLRRRLAEPGWQAPERERAAPMIDPLSALPVDRPSPVPETPTTSVRFTETMKGYFSPDLVPASELDHAQYEEAARRGEAAGRVLSFELTITMSNLLRKHDPELRAGVARGALRVDPLTRPGLPAEVGEGVFQLFVEPSPDGRGPAEQAERRMIYLLPFVGADGRPYLLDGVKVVRDDPTPFDFWRKTTTLYTVIREGHGRDGRVVGSGIASIRLIDFLRQLATMRVIGAGGAGARLDSAASFARLFVGGLWDVFGAPHLRAVASLVDR